MVLTQKGRIKIEKYITLVRGVKKDYYTVTIPKVLHSEYFMSSKNLDSLKDAQLFKKEMLDLLNVLDIKQMQTKLEQLDEMSNITKIANGYAVNIKRKGLRYYKYFKTIEDAQAARNKAYLNYIKTKTFE